MQSHSIRQAYLDYFKQEGHTIVDSSSLVPDNDPTLLFTNSGMVQFKEAFALLQNQDVWVYLNVTFVLASQNHTKHLDRLQYLYPFLIFSFSSQSLI